MYVILIKTCILNPFIATNKSEFLYKKCVAKRFESDALTRA